MGQFKFKSDWLCNECIWTFLVSCFSLGLVNHFTSIQVIWKSNVIILANNGCPLWGNALIIKQTLDAILTLLIWMLSSCCCHCRMFSMRCTQILMFPTSTDLPMSCTRLQSDTYSVCSSSLMGLTFCWSSRTKTEQEQEEFRRITNCLHGHLQRCRNMFMMLVSTLMLH